MTIPLPDTILVPVASRDDARTTVRALRRHLSETPPELHFVNVVEKAGGAPDKASVEQMRMRADEIFEIVADELADAGVETFETDVVYGTDLADAIVDAARERDAAAIVYSPRGGGFLAKVLGGNVGRHLLEDADRPVIVLPNRDDGD